MRQPQGTWRAAVLAALFAAAGAQAQTAQSHDDSTVAKAVANKQAGEIQRGDPARWHQEDQSRQGRLRILQKEIGAAYEEAKKACASAAAAERSACLKDARASYEQDMKNAPAQLDAAPGGSVRTSVQTTVGDSTTSSTTQVTR